jgi:hypothetical protein
VLGRLRGAIFVAIVASFVDGGGARLGMRVQSAARSAARLAV